MTYMGHANITITLDTYSHVSPRMQQAAAKSFDEAFGNRPGTPERGPVEAHGTGSQIQPGLNS